MKKTVCYMLVTVMLALLITALVGCANSPLEKAAKNADSYTIACTYDEKEHLLSATQVLCMTNRSDNSFTDIKLHLYANQYRKDAQNGVVPNAYRTTAYPEGESYGEICFDNVSVDGTSVAFVIEGEDMDILSVPLGKELFPDEAATIEMTYVITIANIRHRLGYTQDAVNLGNFYPVLCNVQNDNYACTPYYNIGDPFVSDISNYDVTITVPKSYLVAASGELTNATAEGDCCTYRYEGKAMRDFAMVLSDKYKKLSQTYGNTQINYYYYNDNTPEASLEAAAGMMEMLSQEVGEYPYPQYSVCETDFCYGGMEYPCLAMIASDTRSYKEAIVHETAHQWFYGIIGNNQIENPWMDEGLAEFLTHVYLDKSGASSLSSFVNANTKTYTTYVDVLNRYYENVDTSFRSIDKFRNDNEYVIMTYVKGSLLFNTLYETLGEAKFFKALTKYYKQAAFTLATPQVLTDCFANVGGTEAASIIHTFCDGKEIIGKITDR